MKVAAEMFRSLPVLRVPMKRGNGLALIIVWLRRNVLMNQSTGMHSRHNLLTHRPGRGCQRIQDVAKGVAFVLYVGTWGEIAGLELVLVPDEHWKQVVKGLRRGRQQGRLC